MNRTAACLMITLACGATFPSAHCAEFLFGEPKKLGAPINTSVIDHSHLSADGRSMYVTSGLGLGQPFGSGGNKSLSVFRRASMSDPWGPREDLGEPVNGGGSTGVPSVTADELSLFYSDTIAHWGPIRPDGFGGGDLWVSSRPSVESDWGESANVGEVINSPYLDADASISADGLSLFFISDRPGGSGDVDIWTSNCAGLQSPWEEPENLGPLVNEPTAERTPSISPDGLTLFFSSRISGTPDLWAASRTDANSPWQNAESLGLKINTARPELSPQLSADGSTLFYSRTELFCACDTPNFEVYSVDILPFEAVSLSAGSEAYSQDFDEALGSDGKATGIALPTGWTTSSAGTVFRNATEKVFPVGSSLGSGANPMLNAGAEGDGDRTLAIGAKHNLEGGMIQLLADVIGDDATSVRLLFDVEAWDARKSSRTDDPGEAAFQVHIDIDRGDGYELLADLGAVTTGLLATPTEDYLDGNATENRVSFDSGRINGSIPTGSKLRVRWNVDRERQTNNWVFGLDNVSLALVGSAGDFNLDGVLDILDLDTLNSAIQTGSEDTQFDVDQSGLVDRQDLQHWVIDLKQTWFGDANFDGEFKDDDIVSVFTAGEYNDGIDLNSTWATGDWNGDQEFSEQDLVAAFIDGGYNQGTRAAVSVVPEPSSFVMILMAGLLGLVHRRRKK